MRFKIIMPSESKCSAFFASELSLSSVHDSRLTTHDCIVLRYDDEKLDSDLAWAANRPCSLWKESSTSTNANAPVPAPPSSSDDDAWERCLTETEKRFLDKYETDKPGGIYSLNQNPDVTNMGTNGQAGFTLYRYVRIHIHTT